MVKHPAQLETKAVIRQTLLNLFRSGEQSGQFSPGDSLSLLAVMEQALYYITEAASHAKFSNQIYQDIANMIPQVTNYDASTISLYEGKGDEFKVLGYANLPHDWVDEVASNGMVINAGVIADFFKSQKLAEQEPMTFENFNVDPVSQQPSSRPDTGGMVMFPLQLGATNWGILTLQSKKPIVFTSEEVTWVKLIGKHCELLIKNAQRVFAAKRSMIEQDEQLRHDLITELTKVIQDKVPYKEKPLLEISPLTRQEHNVLNLISTGATNQEIAEKLTISISTVKKHVSSLFSKLNVMNRTQAMQYAKKLLEKPD
jgi:DNA-binding CsgD family transcriptional regulator